MVRCTLRALEPLPRSTCSARQVRHGRRYCPYGHSYRPYRIELPFRLYGARGCQSATQVVTPYEVGGVDYTLTLTIILTPTIIVTITLTLTLTIILTLTLTLTTTSHQSNTNMDTQTHRDAGYNDQVDHPASYAVDDTIVRLAMSPAEGEGGTLDRDTFPIPVTPPGSSWMAPRVLFILFVLVFFKVCSSYLSNQVQRTDLMFSLCFCIFSSSPFLLSFVLHSFLLLPSLLLSSLYPPSILPLSSLSSSPRIP